MKIFLLVTFSLVLLSLVVSGCGSVSTHVPATPEPSIDVAEPPADQPGFTRLPGLATATPASTDNTAVIPEEILEKAKADLAGRLGISKDKVNLINAKAVTWPDASLGCPQPGMVYAQVITPGYWIVLEAVGQMYEYHSDKRGIVILCELTDGASNSQTDTDKNIVDGWPNQTKDKDAIIVTPTQKQ